ncbi:MAG: hypothetical protein AAB685_02660 [Patescibacteria group bacterium]
MGIGAAISFTMYEAQQQLLGERGQEIMCNSLGEMFSLKLTGQPYQGYLNTLRILPPLTFPDIIGQFQSIPFSENLFNATPTSRAIKLR